MSEIARTLLRPFYCREIGPGNWRFVDRATNRFISKYEAIGRWNAKPQTLRDSLGRFVGYDPFRSAVGMTSLSPAGRWIVGEESVSPPQVGDRVGPGQQLVATIEYSFKGEVIATRKIGLGGGEPFTLESYRKFQNTLEDYRGLYADDQGVPAEEIDSIELGWELLDHYRTGVD
jgi:hypothetical protein